MMEKPSLDDLMWLNHLHLYGRDMKNETHWRGDETIWSFPRGIKEKIKDDKQYSVYYDITNSPDSSDMTTHYHVRYIEEIV